MTTEQTIMCVCVCVSMIGYFHNPEIGGDRDWKSSESEGNAVRYVFTSTEARSRATVKLPRSGLNGKGIRTAQRAS